MGNETIELLDELHPISFLKPTGNPSLEVDHSSAASMAISTASKTLVMTMGLKYPLSEIVEPIAYSHVTPTSRLHVDPTSFVDDVVSIAELSELYSANVDPAKNLRHLAEIAQVADRFRISSRPSSVNSTTIIPEEDPPQSQSHDLDFDVLELEILSHLSSMSSDGREPTDVSQDTLASRNNSVGAGDLSQIDIPSINIIDKASSREHVDTRGQAAVTIKSSKTKMGCTFDIERFEGSVTISATSTSSDALCACVESRPTLHPSSDTSKPTIQHCFPSQYRPIPHLLHPDVEGPTLEPDAPYVITFTERQYIYEQGSPQWTTSLRYIFQEKHDRHILCEKIFGKRLVVIVGTNKLSYNGHISHMSAVALWEDYDSAAARSITFYTFPGKKSHLKDVELTVHGLWNQKKASRSSSALEIAAHTISNAGKNTEVDNSPKSQTIKMQKCVIEFTHLGDREAFLKCLK